MSWRRSLVSLLLSGSPLGFAAADGGPLDFSYSVRGRLAAPDVLVFNDGTDTFVQVPGSGVTNWRVEGAAWVSDGPYLRLAGVPAKFTVVNGASRSEVVHRNEHGALAAAEGISSGARPACDSADLKGEVRLMVSFAPGAAVLTAGSLVRIKALAVDRTPAFQVTILSRLQPRAPGLGYRRLRAVTAALLDAGLSQNQLATGVAEVPAGSVQILAQTKSDSPCPGAIGRAQGAARESSDAPAGSLQPVHQPMPGEAEPLTDPSLDRTTAPMIDGPPQPLPSVTLAADLRASAPSELHFPANSSVRKVFAEYLHLHQIAIDWRVPGDLVVEEAARVDGASAKEVIRNALRRLGLRGTLIADRVLVIEAEPKG